MSVFEAGMVMDQEVRLEFNNLNKKFDEFILAQTRLCGDRGERLAKVEQQLENNEKQEGKDIEKKKVKFSYDRLIVSIIVGGFGVFEILKHAGVLK